MLDMLHGDAFLPSTAVSSVIGFLKGKSAIWKTPQARSYLLRTQSPDRALWVTPALGSPRSRQDHCLVSVRGCGFRRAS